MEDKPVKYTDSAEYEWCSAKSLSLFYLKWQKESSLYSDCQKR